MARKGPAMSGANARLLSIARALALDPRSCCSTSRRGSVPAIIPAVKRRHRHDHQPRHAILIAESNIHHVPDYTTRSTSSSAARIIFGGPPDDAWRDTTVRG